MKNNKIFLLIIVAAMVTASLSATNNDLFKAGSTESKVFNCLKIGAGTIALIGTYKQNFFFGTSTCFAGLACLANGIKGLENDIENSNQTTKEKIAASFEHAKIRIKKAFDALFN